MSHILPNRRRGVHSRFSQHIFASLHSDSFRHGFPLPSSHPLSSSERRSCSWLQVGFARHHFPVASFWFSSAASLSLSRSFGYRVLIQLCVHIGFSRRNLSLSGLRYSTAPETLSYGEFMAFLSLDTSMTEPVTLRYVNVDSPFGAHRAPVTEPATTYALGRLRASHAVCLRYSTLEPVICARKEEADNESVSTSERNWNQSSAMRSLKPSFQTDSLHSSSASAKDFSDSLPRPLRSEKTPNNGAAENRSGRLRSVTACASASGASADSGRSACAPPLGTGCARPEPPSAVSELESLGDFAHVS